MPKLTFRRRFLLGSATILTGSALIYRDPLSIFGSSDKDSPDTLSLMIDTIVPNASELNLDQRLHTRIKNEPAMRGRVERLVLAVEKSSLTQFKKSFVKLDIEERETLLNDMLSAQSPLTARKDLNRVRNTLFHFYYTSELGRTSVGFVLPSHYTNY